MKHPHVIGTLIGYVIFFLFYAQDKGFDYASETFTILSWPAISLLIVAWLTEPMESKSITA